MNRLACILMIGGLLGGGVACSASSDDAGSSSEDAFTGEEGVDALTGVREGSDEAKAILRVANELDASALGFCDAVGNACKSRDHAFLDRALVQSIVGYRSGRDGKLATADDRPIASLASLRQLTRQPNVIDQYTLQALMRVALLRGWVFGYDAAAIAAIADGSPEADAVVRAANELPKDALGFGPNGATNAYLGVWAADAIATRQASGHPFTSLADLRSSALSHDVLVKEVSEGEVADDVVFSVAQLLRSAKQRGWLMVAPPKWDSGWPAGAFTATAPLTLSLQITRSCPSGGYPANQTLQQATSCTVTGPIASAKIHCRMYGSDLDVGDGKVSADGSFIAVGGDAEYPPSGNSHDKTVGFEGKLGASGTITVTKANLDETFAWNPGCAPAITPVKLLHEATGTAR